MTSLLSRKRLGVDIAADGNTTYTSSMDFWRCQGDATVFISSTAGRITITQQVSIDDVNWYSPIDTAAAPLGTVATLLTVTTGTYVSYSPILAPFIRFKIVENLAATVVNLIFIFREER